MFPTKHSNVNTVLKYNTKMNIYICYNVCEFKQIRINVMIKITCFVFYVSIHYTFTGKEHNILQQLKTFLF